MNTDRPSRKTVVITQPMYFPWVGLFEQIRLADEIVWLDDVQFARGFINRVQLKQPTGTSWVTIPLADHRSHAEIRSLQVQDDLKWRSKHLKSLRSSLAGSPHLEDSARLLQDALSIENSSLLQILIRGLESMCGYFGLDVGRKFHLSSELGHVGSKSDLILDIVQRLDGTSYITGLGALNYLDHEKFDASGIEVRYMDYRKTEYPQRHGPFTPFVTALDLVANTGPESISWIDSPSIGWQNMLERKKQKPTVGALHD